MRWKIVEVKDEISTLFTRVKYEYSKVRMNIKAAYQRAWRGWADEDWWNIDLWFIKNMKPLLTQLREKTISYPSNLTFDEWHAILTRMIDCLEWMDYDEVLDKVTDEEAYRQGKKNKYDLAYDYVDKNKTIFFKLFAEYFYDLWD